MPYDVKLTKADGKGQWWEGLDPQDLYAQNHTPGKYDWERNPAKGSSVPDAAYMEKFFKRTLQLWDDYHPRPVYFDDTVLPFHGVTDDRFEPRRAFLQHRASIRTAAPRP